MSNQDINTIVKKLTIRLAAVIIIAVGGMLIKDHFALENKISKEDYWKAQYNLTLMVESKTRILESLAKTNKADISHISKDIDELKTIQREIDRHLRDESRGRGYNSPLSKY